MAYHELGHTRQQEEVRTSKSCPKNYYGELPPGMDPKSPEAAAFKEKWENIGEKQTIEETNEYREAKRSREEPAGPDRANFRTTPEQNEYAEKKIKEMRQARDKEIGGLP